MASAANQPGQKSKANVYTVMLIVAFLALSLATIILHVELYGSPDRYGTPPWSVSGGGS